MDIKEWHEIRSKNVGSSEVAALFGVSPWTTEFELWHIKNGTGSVKEPDHSLIEAGRHLEAGLAQWAIEKWDWPLVKGEYTKHPTVKGLACSPDYIDNEKAPVEFKFSEFGTAFEYDGDELTDAPIHYMLQVQHQISCLGAKHGWLVAYKGGKLRRMRIERSERMVQEIENRVTNFWFSIENKIEPDPDFRRDTEMIKHLNREVIAGKQEDMSGNNRLATVLSEMAEAKRRMDIANDEYETLKNEVRMIVADNQVVTCGDFVVKNITVKGSNGTLVTPEMVGTYIGSRKPYVRMDVKKKENEDE